MSDSLNNLNQVVRKSNYAKKIENRDGKFENQRSNSTSHSVDSYHSQKKESFVVVPLSVDENLSDIELSVQAQEFLKSEKNRIQINNQSETFEFLNDIDDEKIDYKNIDLISKLITKTGEQKRKYKEGRGAKNPSTKKRGLASKAVKKARFLALIGYPNQNS
jgi:ribosomal protein S18